MKATEEISRTDSRVKKPIQADTLTYRFPQRQSTLINLPRSWASQVFGRKSACE